MRTLKGNYRTADGKAQIEWSLEVKDGRQVFSASGDYAGSSGQCLDEIGAAYPNDPTVQEMVDVWREWHLNDMHAGTAEQEATIKRWIAEGNTYEYGAVCRMLQSKGIYEVPSTCYDIPEDFEKATYKYGERWLYRAIPDSILQTIERWTKLPALNPLHEEQARIWLANHALTLRITLSDSKPAAWEHSGHHYRVTLTGKGRPRLTFDFWGSQHDMEQGKDPTPYDVLSCLSSDSHSCGMSFGEFCSEFGESQDSIKAKQTWQRVSRFAKRIVDFLTPEELESLREIN